MRVALFITCFNDTLFPQTGRATVTVLERVGAQVEFPLEQTCCGQMHANSGYGHEAIGLVRERGLVDRDDPVVAPVDRPHPDDDRELAPRIGAGTHRARVACADASDRGSVPSG